MLTNLFQKRRIHSYLLQHEFLVILDTFTRIFEGLHTVVHCHSHDLPVCTEHTRHILQQLTIHTNYFSNERRVFLQAVRCELEGFGCLLHCLLDNFIIVSK